MRGTPRRVFGPALLTAAAATKYTVGSGLAARLVHVHVFNEDSAPHSFTISIGADAAGTEIYKTFPIAALAPFDWYPYLPMAAGEIVQAYADLTNVLNMFIGAEEWVSG
jgi:hypothetical protein